MEQANERGAERERVRETERERQRGIDQKDSGKESNFRNVE